jgi:hypothetical protein
MTIIINSEQQSNFIKKLLKDRIVKKTIGDDRYLGEYLLELNNITVYFFYNEGKSRSTYYLTSNVKGVIIDSDDYTLKTERVVEFIKNIIKNGIYIVDMDKKWLARFFIGKSYDYPIIPGFDKDPIPESYKLYAKYIKKQT